MRKRGRACPALNSLGSRSNSVAAAAFTFYLGNPFSRFLSAAGRTQPRRAFLI